MEWLHELRDLVLDHLDPRRLFHELRHGVVLRRPGSDDVGLADRLRVHPRHRALHVRDRLCLSHGGWDLLLGVQARRSRLGLVHRLVQPDRSDRGRGVGRLRGCAVPLDHDPALPPELGCTEPQARLRDLPLPPGGPHDAELLPEPHPQVLEQHLGVLAHPRAGGDRRDPHLRSRPSRERLLRVHAGGPTDRASSTATWAVRGGSSTCCRSGRCF